MLIWALYGRGRYNGRCSACPHNGFTTAAFRFGHSLIRETWSRYKKPPYELFGSPSPPPCPCTTIPTGPALSQRASYKRSR